MWGALVRQSVIETNAMGRRRLNVNTVIPKVERVLISNDESNHFVVPSWLMTWWIILVHIKRVCCRFRFRSTKNQSACRVVDSSIALSVRNAAPYGSHLGEKVHSEDDSSLRIATDINELELIKHLVRSTDVVKATLATRRGCGCCGEREKVRLSHS